MYDYGYGVEQNYSEAAKWYRKSIEQGNAGAQNNLGVLYQYGYGVPQSRQEAIKWYKEAARQGNETAIQNLKKLGITSYQ
jgi:TPR repeat protein